MWVTTAFLKDAPSFVEPQKTKRSDRDSHHNRFIPNDLSSFNLSYFGRWFLITDRIFFYSASFWTKDYLISKFIASLSPKTNTNHASCEMFVFFNIWTLRKQKSANSEAIDTVFVLHLVQKTNEFCL